MHQVRWGLLAAGLLLAVVPGRAMADTWAYAEGVYAEYSAGTGKQVTFEVKTVGAGWLDEIAKVPFGELVGSSGHLVEAQQFGTELRNPRFVAEDPVMLMRPELQYTAAGFEGVGYSLGEGTYRKLEVTTTIGADVRQHQAMEFCWSALGHCTVLDPTVLFLDSMVKSRLRLAAEGWGPQAVEGPPSDEYGMTAVCGLASNPSVTNRSLTWGGYWIEYKDVFGIVLVRKTLGAQQSGIRCNTSCQPAPYGYSNASSCQGFLGWSCGCDNDFGYGTTGSTGKWIAETKCTHKFLLQASASASVSNLGSASVSINWALDGSPDGNGGQMMDTCGYY